MAIRADIQSLAPTALLDFFILDTTNLPGGSVMRFHAGTNSLSQPVVWQGQTYEPMPIEAEGFDVTAKGALPRPRLRVANVNGFLSASVKSFNDFVGCKVTRKRTFAKYLDSANFPPPRNLAVYTDYSASAWSNAVPANATLTTGVADPFGGNTAIRFRVGDGVTGHTAAGVALLRVSGQSIPVGAGEAHWLSFYCRATALPTSSALVDAGDNNPSGNYLSQLILNQWVRVAMVGARATAGTVTFFDLWSNNSQACTLEFAGLQFEKGSLTDYQSVPGATYIANPIADPNQFIPDDLWYVERKVSENRYMIEFELSSAFDLMGQQLPNRQIIQNTCSWKYRGSECGWTGGNFDKSNNPSGASDDACAKTLAACKVRFNTQPIRFGGFPGAIRGTT